MSEDARGQLSRRTVLSILGAAVGGAATASAFLDERDGNLYGGKMALNETYKRGDGLWIGPDSGRNNVPADDGNIFIGASGDGYTLYHGDGGSWTKNGLGDNANPIPSVTTEEGHITERARLPAINKPTNDEFVMSYGANYYSGDGVLYNTDSHYSTDGGDTWSALATTPPSGTSIKLQTSNYIFAGDGSPLTIYRAPYPDVVSGSGGSWTQVLQGQSGSTIFGNDGGRFPGAMWEEDGTLIAAEYGDPGTPKVYRSTDAGASWGTVHTCSSSVDHAHVVSADPYVDERWIISLGDGISDPFLESTDDGVTWTRTSFGPTSSSQAVGIDYGPDYLFFHDDNSSYEIGPWVYSRSDGATGALCSTHPAQKFTMFLIDPIGYAIHHNRDTGVTYFQVRDPGNTHGWVLAYSRWIGDEPQLLSDTFRNNMVVTDSYVCSVDRRYTKPDIGGV